MKRILVTITSMALALAPLAGKDVRIVTDSSGAHHLLRDGTPYVVKGANWPTPETIQALVDTGGNAIRTYGNEVEWMLPLARRHNLTLMLGLSIGRERQGFDYTDQAARDAQLERLRETVRRYRNEPELLIWAIGNEPELNATNTVALWKEVNRIARMVHEEDPYHPVVTVVAGFDKHKIQQLLAHCPDLDALGVNWYGPAAQWPANLLSYGWTKPYLHTEFGPLGYWKGAGGRGFTLWGAPIEQTSTEKAALYTENWRDAVIARPQQSLGGYAFIWGPKQERTHTWFSMHLFGGERTELVDAMETAWTGRAPSHPAPKILKWESARSPDEYQPGETIKVHLRWSCSRPSELKVETRTESTAHQVGGDAESVPRILPHTNWKSVEGGIEVAAPDQPGNYRLFVLITTADKTAATANLPISVKVASKP